MSEKGQSRSRLLRDLIVFQVKLFADGLRDVLLSPLSFVAALADVITGKHGPESNFYSLLRAGKKTDGWIDLFGAADRLDPEAPDSELDKMLDKLETELTESYREGRLSAAAKDALEKASVMLGTASPVPRPAEANVGQTKANAAASTDDVSEVDDEPASPANQPSDDKPRSA